MIIGNNNENNFFNKNFIFEEKKIQQQKKASQENIFTQEMNAFKYTNPTNNNEMYNKSLAILNERLKNKTITMEEFNKQCAQLAKNSKIN